MQLTCPLVLIMIRLEEAWFWTETRQAFYEISDKIMRSIWLQWVRHQLRTTQLNTIRLGTLARIIYGSRHSTIQALPRENSVCISDFLTKNPKMRSHTDTIVSTHEGCQQCGSQMEAWIACEKLFRALTEIPFHRSSIFPRSSDDVLQLIYTQSRYFRAYRANYASVIRKRTFVEGVWICGITYAHTAELSHIWFSWSFNASVRAGSTLEKATAWNPLAHELVKLFVYMQVSLPDCPPMRRNIRFWVAGGSPHLPGRLKCANTTFQVGANSYMKLNDCFHMGRLALQ